LRNGRVVECTGLAPIGMPFGKNQRPFARTGGSPERDALWWNPSFSAEAY